MIPISYNVRSLLVRKATSSATALGIALVVFVLAAALMLSAGIKKTLVLAGSPDNAIVLRKGADAEMSSSIETKNIGLVLSAPGVMRDSSGNPLGSAEVVVVITADKLGTDGQVSNLLVRGVSETALRVRPEVRVTQGRIPKPGTDEAMVGRGIAGRFNGVALGSKCELKKNRPLNVVGIFEAGGSSLESEVWADLDTVRAAFGREGSVTSITVRLESPLKYDAFESAIESDKRLELEAMREKQYYEKQSEGTSLFVTALGATIAFFFSVGAMIGAAITMHAAVAQRRREIGTLRAVGFSRTSILVSFLFESCLLACVGGLLGIGFALGLGFAEFSMMNFATWQEITFTFTPTPSILVTALVFGCVMGLIGGLIPAFKAARVSPIEAMRG